MPDSRPWSTVRSSAFDDPPATSDAPSPYPNRHMRLRRALQNTNDLARDISREARAGYSPAVDTQRTTSAGFLRRTRRRLQDHTYGNAVDDQAEDAPEGRSSKRRKLNDSSPPAVKKPIKYGRYGQVESGRLRMEILSNDGGEHQDPRNPGIFLGAKNMLKLDKSVYCSERTSASIVLRHADKTPFSLEKLHIVGPEHGFTAPVREGIAYIAMDMKDLQPYLDPPFYARRAGHDDPPLDRYRGIRASPERLTLSDALRDPEIATAANQRYSPFPRDDLEEPEDDEPYYGANYLVSTDPETHCDVPSPPPETYQSTSRPDPITFTLVSDEDVGQEETSPPEVLDYRLQRLRRMGRRYNTDEWDRTNNGVRNGRFSFADEGEENPWAIPNTRLEALMRPARTYLSPSPGETPRSPPYRSRMPRIDAPAPGAEDPSVHAAPFHIKYGKSRVAIKFDPPISGRYILLKLRAGRSNVDVQSVIAKGYAGPRFFPAMQFA